MEDLSEGVRLIHLKAGKEATIHKMDVYFSLAEFTFNLENFWKCHQGLSSNGGDWVSFHRHFGRDIVKGDRVESGPNMGTSEAPMRNQMKAWLQYMGGSAK